MPAARTGVRQYRQISEAVGCTRPELLFILSSCLACLQVYSALGRQAKRKRQHFNDVKIVVAGCVAQQEGKQLLRRVPEVDVVMGPQHANQIHNLVSEAETGQVCYTPAF